MQLEAEKVALLEERRKERQQMETELHAAKAATDAARAEAAHATAVAQDVTQALKDLARKDAGMCTSLISSCHT